MYNNPINPPSCPAKQTNQNPKMLNKKKPQKLKQKKKRITLKNELETSSPATAELPRVGPVHMCR